MTAKKSVKFGGLPASRIVWHQALGSVHSLVPLDHHFGQEGTRPSSRAHAAPGRARSDALSDGASRSRPHILSTQGAATNP
jgi:hypothetical protein